MLSMILMGLTLAFAGLVAYAVVPKLPRWSRPGVAMAAVFLSSMAGALATGGPTTPDVTAIVTAAQTTYNSVVPIVIAVVTLGVVISLVKLVKKR